MRQKLIGITVFFSAMILLITAVLYTTGKQTDTQEIRAGQVLAVNEIEQLARAGEWNILSEKSAQLRDSLRMTRGRADSEYRLFFLCGISVLFLMTVVGYVYAAILRPFDKMKIFAQTIAKGDLEVPLAYERSNYFGAFTWAFDSMRREILKARACEHEAIENNKTVIATLSHDIKTPIASIRAYAEGLEANLDTTAEKRERYIRVLMKMSLSYTGMFPEIIAAILSVFILLLTVIVMIVMGHSISSGIEMDAANLGILKSYGFSKKRIRLIFVLQYALAELCGTVIGILLSIPLIRILCRTLWQITATAIEDRIAVGKSLAALAAMLLFSCLFIFLITGKVGNISPVRAIAGGRPEIYFDSRIKAPVFSKALLPSLAFRQFVSGRRRYAASVMTAAILVFFMMSMTLLAHMLTSKTAVQAMGSPFGECAAEFLHIVSVSKQQEIEQTVEAYSEIEAAYYMTNTYFSIEGEEIMCTIYQNPEQFSMLKGRAPIYDNEIVITEILAEELELQTGDEVMIGFHGAKQTYLVSGIYQFMSDAGKCFGMSGTGAERIGFRPVYMAAYSLKEPDKAAAVPAALICVCFFVFAYQASGRIRRVSVRELVTE